MKRIKKIIPFGRNDVKGLKYKIPGLLKSFDPHQSITLFCDPRGGSTWLAQTLKAIPNSLLLNEPLHLNNDSELRKMKFYWQQYIPEEVDWRAARAYFAMLQSGQRYSYGLCSLNSVKELVQADILVLKIIRGKALLPWYVKQFNFKYTPLFIVRHPFAVVASKLAHPAWQYTFKRFELPDSPHLDIYQAHLPFLQSLETKAEQILARWCIGNNVVLHHSQNDKAWITMNYEDLILDPQKQFTLLFERWGMPMPDTLMERINRPSSTTVGNKSIETQNLLQGWKAKLEKTQIDRLQEVLAYFGVDYYGQDSLPLIPADQVHLRRAKP